jgi:hypothetical protein
MILWYDWTQFIGPWIAFVCKTTNHGGNNFKNDVFGYFWSQMSDHHGLDGRMLQLMKFCKLLIAIMIDGMEYEKPQTQQK